MAATPKPFRVGITVVQPQTMKHHKIEVRCMCIQPLPKAGHPAPSACRWPDPVNEASFVRLPLSLCRIIKTEYLAVNTPGRKRRKQIPQRPGDTTRSRIHALNDVEYFQWTADVLREKGSDIPATHGAVVCFPAPCKEACRMFMK